MFGEFGTSPGGFEEIHGGWDHPHRSSSDFPLDAPTIVVEPGLSRGATGVLLKVTKFLGMGDEIKKRVDS